MNDTENYESIHVFLNNVKDKYSSYAQAHNVYLLQTYDEYGNLTDEKYGLNLMTDYGFKVFYSNELSRQWFKGDDAYIFLGNNPDNLEPTYERSMLYNRVIGSSGSIDSHEKTFIDEWYDKDDDLIVGMCRIFKTTFDYNVNDVNGSKLTTDVDLTEVGYGTTYNTLISHSRVFDINGDLANIKKRPNEKLTITLFMNCCMRGSLFEEWWDQGIYAVFEINKWLFIRHYFDSVSDSDRYGSVCAECSHHNVMHGEYNWWNTNKSYGYDYFFHQSHTWPFWYYNNTTNAGTFTRNADDSITWESNKYSFLWEDKYARLDYYGWEMNPNTTTNIDSAKPRPVDVFFLKKLELETAEEVTFNKVYTNNYEVDHLVLSFGFGDYDWISCSSYMPIYNLHITSVNRYNFATDSFDISVPFHDEPNIDYSETMLCVSGSFYIKCPDNISRTVYVHCNPNYQTLKITKFDNSGMTVWAADKFYDISTWDLISNIQDIPASPKNLQQKKYYISTTSTPLNVQKIKTSENDVLGIDNDVHRLNLPASEKPYSYPNTFCKYINGTNQYDIYSNSTYGYVYNNFSLMYLDDTTKESTLIDLETWLLECEGRDPGYVPFNPSEYTSSCYCRYRHANPYKTGKYLIFQEIKHSYKGYSYKPDDYSIISTNAILRIFDTSVQNPSLQAITDTYRRIELNFDKGEDLNADNYKFTTFENSNYIVCRSANYTYETVFLNLETEEQTLIDHAQSGIIMYGTTYCVYFDTVADYGESGFSSSKYAKIYDMETKTIIDQFEFPSDDGYQVLQMFAMDGFVYFYASASSLYWIFIYDMSSGELIKKESPMSGENAWFQQQPAQTGSVTQQTTKKESGKNCYKKIRINNEDIGVYAFLGSGNNDVPMPYIVSTKDPTNIKKVYNGKYTYYSSSDIWYAEYHNIQLQQIGTNIYLIIQTSQTHNVITYWKGDLVVDVGYVLNRGTYAYHSIPFWKQKFNGEKDCSFKNSESGNFTIYKNRVLKLNIDNNIEPIKSYPIEYFVPLQVTGTTKTFQCWNNPKQITNLGVSMTITNRINLSNE